MLAKCAKLGSFCSLSGSDLDTAWPGFALAQFASTETYSELKLKLKLKLNPNTNQNEESWKQVAAFQRPLACSGQKNIRPDLPNKTICSFPPHSYRHTLSCDNSSSNNSNSNIGSISLPLSIQFQIQIQNRNRIQLQIELQVALRRAYLARLI